jgi:hypothetical protein
MQYVERPSGLLVPKHLQSHAGAFRLGGKFKGSLFRKGVLIDEWESKNLAVNQGLNDALNCYFNVGGQTTTWYMGIFQGNYTPVSTDTAATIAGNSTECSSYSSGTRPQWQQAAPSGQSITNAANRATYTFTGSVTIYGAFLISQNTIGGSSGVLFAAAQFGASKAVVSSDQLLLTYQINALPT